MCWLIARPLSLCLRVLNKVPPLRLLLPRSLWLTKEEKAVGLLAVRSSSSVFDTDSYLNEVFVCFLVMMC